MKSEVVTQDQISRAKVFALEKLVLEQPQVECKVDHIFFPGGYARSMHIPKGVVLTGGIHKYASFNILAQGEITVLTADGTVRRVSAGYSEMSPAGMKRTGLAHEDCIWTTVLATNLTDVAEIEKYFTTNDESEYLEFVEQQLQLGE